MPVTVSSWAMLMAWPPDLTAGAQVVGVAALERQHLHAFGLGAIGAVVQPVVEPGLAVRLDDHDLLVLAAVRGCGYALAVQQPRNPVVEA